MRPSEELAPASPGDVPAEAVARRAYEIYLERGGGQDRELEDWLQAEAQLRREAPTAG
jgi:Protein of unknown function (DUF2934)